MSVVAHSQMPPFCHVPSFVQTQKVQTPKGKFNRRDTWQSVGIWRLRERVGGASWWWWWRPSTNLNSPWYSRWGCKCLEEKGTFVLGKWWWCILGLDQENFCFQFYKYAKAFCEVARVKTTKNINTDFLEKENILLSWIILAAFCFLLLSDICMVTLA